MNLTQKMYSLLGFLISSATETLLLTSIEELKLGQRNLDAKLDSILVALNTKSDGPHYCLKALKCL